MANIIQLKRSSVAGKRPDAVDLQVGEIAVNLADGILYSKNTAGYVVVVGSAKTSNVIEDGNLYFTTARARSSISAGDSSIIYDSVNGTIRANVAALGGANVISVNGFDGIVVLDTDDISEGSANLYYTDERVYSNVVLLDYATNTLVGALYDQSNTNATVIGLAFDEANAASGTAGVVFDQSNTNITIIGLAFDQANTATTYALSAYDQANTVFDTVNALTTTEVTEGDNLYFTNTRAISAFTPGTGINIDANGLILSTVTGGEGGSGGGNVTVSSSPPVSPVQGDVWIDAETGAYLTYFSDGDSNQWAEVASSIVFGGQGGGVADLTSNIIIGTDGDPTNVIIHSTITGNLTPSDNEVYDLGSSELKWKDLYLSGNTINLGNATISASGDAIVLPENTTVGSAAIATPRISSIDYPGDDTAADPNGNQIISIIGSGFASGASVVIDGTTVGVVSFISSTELQIISPAKAAGSYTLYVINPDGGTGIFIPGFQYSGTPTWNSPSAGSLGSVYETGSISETLNATSDGTVTYSLLSGTLPAGATLDANAGTITGTASNVDSPTTYNFTIRATDEENQDTDRAFSLTIDPDAISWVTPTEGSIIQLEVDAASNTNLLATSLANDTITYSANALPTGLTLTGNVVSGTPNTVGNVSATLTASGDNTNKSNVISITWSIVVGGDQFFKNTTLLLNGDGTNGAQNNSFIDSSDNNFAFTRGGNITQGTFTPFSAEEGKWSNYFDGSTYATVANNSAFALSGDFTIEAWAYFNSISSSVYSVIAGIWNGSGTYGWLLHVKSNEIHFASGNSGSSDANYQSATTIEAGKWYHFAVTRSGSSVRIFQDGVQVGTTYTGTENMTGTAALQIGWNDDGNQQYLNGHISNLRIVKGRAVYTSNFTPSSSPLGVTSGGQNPPQGTETSLLTCQSNRFLDNSSNGFAVTPTGAKVTAFSPFARSESYLESVNGGSAYFDGLQDQLSRTSDALFNFSTGDWTVEAWVYRNGLDNQKGNILSVGTGGSALYSSFAFGRADGSVFVGFGSGAWGWSSQNTSSAGGIKAYSWHHVAVVKSGSSLLIYVDGVNVFTGTPSFGSGQGGSIYHGSYFQNYNNDGSWFNGYVSGFRILKGTALYTSNFTPPTSPPTKITNTALLFNYTNAGIKDLTGKNNIETVGNAQISTSVKKYGSGSLAFDGAGDYLTLSPSENFIFGTGDFTVEFWMNATTVNSVFRRIVTNILGGFDVNTFVIRLHNTNKLQVYFAGADVVGSTTINTGTWYHVAAVRNGSSCVLYLNGSSDGSTTSTGNVNKTTLYVGGFYDVNSTEYFHGYVDDLRITKGVARYTSNFTPPTSAFATK